MTDYNVEAEVAEAADIPEIDENLEILMIQTIDQARQRMEQGQPFIPFTAVLAEDTVYEDEHAGDTDAIFESAKATVCGIENARCYAFCYDGFVETEDGSMDAIIAEGGVAGEAKGVTLGLLYEIKGDKLSFDEGVCYIDETDNHLADKDPLPLIELDEQ